MAYDIKNPLESALSTIGASVQMFQEVKKTNKLLGLSLNEDYEKIVGLKSNLFPQLNQIINPWAEIERNSSFGFGYVSQVTKRIAELQKSLLPEFSKTHSPLMESDELNKILTSEQALKQIIMVDSLISNDRLRLEQWASNTSHDLKKHLGLIVSLDHYSALTNSTAVAQFNSLMKTLQNPIYKKGFLLTADLALSSQMARGFASDILQNYDQSPNTDNSLFGLSLKFIKQDDDNDWELRKSNSIFQQALAWFDTIPEKDRLRWGAAAVIFFMLCEIFNSTINYKGFQNDIEVREISEATDAKRAELEAKRYNQQGHDERYVKYLVARTPLRVEPHRQALMIRLVFPDQSLRVLNSKGDWLYVEVFDYQSDQPIEGWLYRGNVRAKPQY